MPWPILRFRNGWPNLGRNCHLVASRRRRRSARCKRPKSRSGGRLSRRLISRESDSNARRTMSADDRSNHFVTTIDQLSALYGEPHGNAIAKETDRITESYRALIEAAPFFALASAGADGLDCSPRGDAPGFVRVADEKTLLVPDRRGNNRIDTLRNILADPRVALLFLIPGCGETIRITGRAAISIDPKLTQSFLVEAP